MSTTDRSATAIVRDLTDDECRSGLLLKWGATHIPGFGPDVLPAWVAEMDYALAPCITDAIGEAARRSATGYPSHNTMGVAEALAEFAQRRYDWTLDPAKVTLTSDVMTGVRLAIATVCDPAPVVTTTPVYYPFLEVVGLTGRERWDLPLDPNSINATIDLDRLDRLFAQGARTLLLSQPHNPWGRVFTRAELEGIRDVCLRYGAKVISDEIHAPLVFDGNHHLSYLAVEGTSDHAVVVTSCSKAFNTAGLKCAQMVTGASDLHQSLQELSNLVNGGLSVMGAAVSRAAYTDGDAWLDALLAKLSANRDQFAYLLAEQLPDAHMRHLEATYLAFVDARAYGYDNPSALALEKGRVYVADGGRFGQGGHGWVRVNLATSTGRITEIIRRLHTAWTEGNPSDSALRR